MESSRRGFLKGASVTVAALAVSMAMPALARSATASGPVQLCSKCGDRRHASGPALNWKPASELASDAIVLNPSATRQEVLGFGDRVHRRVVLDAQSAARRPAGRVDA